MGPNNLEKASNVGPRCTPLMEGVNSLTAAMVRWGCHELVTSGTNWWFGLVVWDLNP